MPENDGIAAVPASDQSAAAGGDGSGGAAAWQAQLPSDLKGNEAFTSFKTIGDLGKTYLETSGKVKESESKVKEQEDKVKALEGRLTTDYIPKPKENATEAEKQAYFKALGRPDKVEDYKFEAAKLPPGAEKAYDPKIESWFKEKFFQAGLSKEQAVFLNNEYNTGFVERFNQMATAKEQARQDSATKLKAEWGNKFDENLIVAERALEHFGGKELRDYLEETGLKNDVRMIRTLHEIGKSIQDDTLILGKRADSIEAREPGKLKYPSMEAA